MGKTSPPGQTMIPRFNENLGIIAVEDDAGRRAAAGQGHVQGVNDQAGPHVVGDGPADDCP
jgi:hypothetical protein